MISEALRAPRAVGVKVRVMVQLAPMPRLAPHVVVRAKSPAFAPVIKWLVIDRAAVAEPALASVTVWSGLSVFSPWLANVTAVGDTEATGAPPVPLSATFTVACTGSLVAMANEPVRAPVLAGRKVTLMVQNVPGARLAPQV